MPHLLKARNMKPETLATLLNGNFVCRYVYPDAYDELQAPGAADDVGQWLSRLGLRLARLGDDGAFYVAPLLVQTNEQLAKVKADFLNFRNSYGLLAEMLNLIRLTNETFRCMPGEYVHLTEVVSRVNEDSTLVARLREMRLPSVDSRMSNHEMLRKMLERLRNDGYLVLSNPKTETYQVTGKIDHLHQVFQYLNENVPDLSYTAIDPAEEEEEQGDLIRSSRNGAAT